MLCCIVFSHNFAGDAYKISSTLHKKYRGMSDKQFFRDYRTFMAKVQDNRHWIAKKYGFNNPFSQLWVGANRL